MILSEKAPTPPHLYLLESNSHLLVVMDSFYENPSFSSSFIRISLHGPEAHNLQVSP